MALSIKNPRAEQLAAEVARETGETMTDAVIHALEEKLDRIRGRHTFPALTESLMEISARCSELPDVDGRTAAQILGYDRHGLPG